MTSPITHSFSTALSALKAGGTVQRLGWNGSGLTVKMQVPDEGSMNTLPYLYIQYPLTSKTTPGARGPWVPSSSDLFAEDWIIVLPERSDSST